MTKHRRIHEADLGRASLDEWGPLLAGETGDVCVTHAGRAVAQMTGERGGGRIVLLGANVNDLALAVPVATLTTDTPRPVDGLPAYLWPRVADGSQDTQLMLRLLFREVAP